MEGYCSACGTPGHALTAIGADPSANVNWCPECVLANEKDFYREMGWKHPSERGRPASATVNPAEWQYDGNVVDLGRPCETCQLCGQLDLRYHFEIVHRTSPESLWIGSECIKRFDIAVVRDGRILDRRAAARVVDSDRRMIEKQARTRSVLNSLIQLAAADPDFDKVLQKFIGYYSSRGAFTPKQMALLQWRFSVTGVEHNSNHFKVSLRRAREQGQLQGMEDWKREKLAPYLSPAQRRRWLD